MRKPTAIALARAAHRRRSQLLRAPTSSPAFTAHATRPHTLTPRPQPQPPPSQTPLESTRRPLAASVANSSSTAAAQRQNIRQKRCHVVRLPARGVQSTTGDGSHAREHMYMSIFSVERATLEAQLKAASQARGPRPLHRVLPHLHRLPADSTPHPRPLHHHPRHPSRPP